MSASHLTLDASWPASTPLSTTVLQPTTIQTLASSIATLLNTSANDPQPIIFGVIGTLIGIIGVVLGALTLRFMYKQQELPDREGCSLEYACPSFLLYLLLS